MADPKITVEPVAMITATRMLKTKRLPAGLTTMIRRAAELAGDDELTQRDVAALIATFEMVHGRHSTAPMDIPHTKKQDTVPGRR